LLSLQLDSVICATPGLVPQTGGLKTGWAAIGEGEKRAANNAKTSQIMFPRDEYSFSTVLLVHTIPIFALVQQKTRQIPGRSCLEKAQKNSKKPMILTLGGRDVRTGQLNSRSSGKIPRPK
jgi:hypothetical protein